MCGGRMAAALCNAEDDSVVARALRKPVAELDADDARAYGCQLAFEGQYCARGFSAPLRAAGFAGGADLRAGLRGAGAGGGM